MKIRLELNGCTYEKFLLVEYKVDQEKWDRKFELILWI